MIIIIFIVTIELIIVDQPGRFSNANINKKPKP